MLLQVANDDDCSGKGPLAFAKGKWAKKRRGRNTHSDISLGLTQHGCERFCRCPATSDGWKKVMSASHSRQKNKLSLVLLVPMLVLRAFSVQPTCR